MLGEVELVGQPDCESDRWDQQYNASKARSGGVTLIIEELEPLIGQIREVGSKSFMDAVQKLGNVVTIHPKIMPNPC